MLLMWSIIIIIILILFKNTITSIDSVLHSVPGYCLFNSLIVHLCWILTWVCIEESDVELQTESLPEDPFDSNCPPRSPFVLILVVLTKLVHTVVVSVNFATADTDFSGIWLLEVEGKILAVPPSPITLGLSRQAENQSRLENKIVVIPFKQKRGSVVHKIKLTVIV